MTIPRGRNRVLGTIGLSSFFLALAALMFFASTPCALAQQTLGGIRGTVTDQSGAVVPDTVVTVVGDETRLTRSKKSNAEGDYEIVDLPIGTYTLTFTHNGFLTDTIPSHSGAGQSHRHGERVAESRAGEHNGHGGG